MAVWRGHHVQAQLGACLFSVGGIEDARCTCCGSQLHGTCDAVRVRVAGSGEGRLEILGGCHTGVRRVTSRRDESLLSELTRRGVFRPYGGWAGGCRGCRHSLVRGTEVPHARQDSNALKRTCLALSAAKGAPLCNAHAAAAEADPQWVPGPGRVVRVRGASVWAGDHTVVRACRI